MTGPAAIGAMAALTLALCLAGRPIGRTLGLLDRPDDNRKGHARETPLVGGIAVMVPLLSWCAATVAAAPSPPALPLAILIAGGGVASVGLIDDRQPFSPVLRILLLTIFGTVALLIDSGLVAERAYWGFIPASSVNVWFASTIAIVSLVGLMSAVNMADGIDGLALSLQLVWCVCLAVIAHSLVAFIAAVLAAMVLVALVFNLSGRVFLGDCGAYGVTLAIGLLTIEAHNSGNLPIETFVVWFFLPILDCLRLIAQRIFRHRWPWEGDTDHFQHRLARRFGAGSALMLYAGAVASTSALAAIAPVLAPGCAVLLSIFYVVTMAAGRPGAVAPQR